MRLAVDKQPEYAHELLQATAPIPGEALVNGICSVPIRPTKPGIVAQRQRVAEVKR